MQAFTPSSKCSRLPYIAYMHSLVPFKARPRQNPPYHVPSVTSFHGQSFPGAYQLEESLDDVECEYRIPSTTIDPAAGIGPAADEIEVRGVIMNVLYSINEAAKILGIKAEYVGGGNGRSTSFMDWVLRKSGQLSNPEKLSCLVFGAGRVKWEWQLDWKPGETLEAILKDPERRDALLLALQQASFPLC